MENTKTTSLLFKGSWIWHTFDIHVDITLTIFPEVAKPHFLENSQKSLKARQDSYNRAAHYGITTF